MNKKKRISKNTKKCNPLLVLMCTANILFLCSCRHDPRHGQQEVYSEPTSSALPDALYHSEDGKDIKGFRFTAPDGRDFYVVSLGLMSYYDAYRMQRNGWVLPRTLGVFSLDEHRYTSMPTFEMLVGISHGELDEDWTDQNYTINNIDFIEQTIGVNQNATFWTATRFPARKDISNYVLTYLADEHVVQLGKSELSAHNHVILLKDAKLIDRQIPDNMYLAPNDSLYYSFRITANDGHEYDVVTLDDSLTWTEAIAMEKDGWLLPRTRGEQFDASAPSSMWGTLEHYTRHSDCLEPNVEGLSGKDHFTADIISGDIRMVLNSNRRIWLGTPLGEDKAFKAGYTVFDDYKWTYGFVTLFRPILPNYDGILYRKTPHRAVTPLKIWGMSGRAYYVVDPSDWQARIYPKANDVELTEHDGWHVMTFSELEDMLCINDNIESGPVTINTQNPATFLFHIGSFYARQSDETLTLVTRDRNRMFRNDTFYTYAQVRLVKTEQTTGEAEIDQLSEDIDADDVAMYGLNGPVRTVTIRRKHAYMVDDNFCPTGDILEFSYKLEFSRNRFLLRDEHGSTYRYDSHGQFVKGNTNTSKLERDNMRRIVRYESGQNSDGSSYTVTYHYDSQGKLDREDFEQDIILTSTIDYTYDDKGRIAKQRETKEEEGEYEEFITTYKYLEADEYGNWVSRGLKRFPSDVPEQTQDEQYIFYEERTITYWE